LKRILLIAGALLLSSYSLLRAETFTADQLEQLTAPIALYPDLLVSLILPASTQPNDISDAAFYVLGGGNASRIESARWAPSVKSMARYSQVIVWMSYNTPWVVQLGTAFSFQESEVLSSIQRLRQRAIIDGILKDTPEQRVVISDGIIYIEPADSELIYIPIYDANVCFRHATQGLMGPWIIFDRPYFMGEWLTYGCDWKNHHVVSNLKYDSRLSRSHELNRFNGSHIVTHEMRRPIRDPRVSEVITHPELQPGAPQIHSHSPREEQTRVLQPGMPNRSIPQHNGSINNQQTRPENPHTNQGQQQRLPPQNPPSNFVPRNQFDPQRLYPQTPQTNFAPINQGQQQKLPSQNTESNFVPRHQPEPQRLPPRSEPTYTPPTRTPPSQQPSTVHRDEEAAK
jgi:hypothetical protein